MNELTRRDFMRSIALGALAAALPSAWAVEGEGPEPQARAPRPPFPRRGIHVLSGGKASLPALERLVGDIAPSLGLNWVIIEVNGNFQYASHPECAEENPLTKEDAARLATLARDKGLSLVPMYNCLGHQSWKEKAGALLRAHPELNEAPELDATAKDFYCMSWCPNHPDVNRIVFDLLDELVEAFQAKAFHVGMDEVFVLGHCPRCKGKPNAELFAKAVNDLHGHLVGRRGLEMQMWGDRLLDGKATGYGSWEASMNDTAPAIDLVPKDIVMCDWHYEVMEDFPSVRIFQEKGFRVWPAGWNKERSIRRFVEVAREASGPLMLGYLCTTWNSVDELVRGLAGEVEVAEGDRRGRGLLRIVAGVKLGAALARGAEPPSPPTSEGQVG